MSLDPNSSSVSLFSTVTVGLGDGSASRGLALRVEDLSSNPQSLTKGPVISVLGRLRQEDLWGFLES